MWCNGEGKVGVLAYWRPILALSLVISKRLPMFTQTVAQHVESIRIQKPQPGIGAMQFDLSHVPVRQLHMINKRCHGSKSSKLLPLQPGRHPSCVDHSQSAPCPAQHQQVKGKENPHSQDRLLQALCAVWVQQSSPFQKHLQRFRLVETPCHILNNCS